MAPAIQAEGLGKRYRLGERSFGYKTLRETLAAPRRSGEDERREIWALRELDLEIDEGDIVGIVGRNGAGKTTFLKAVAHIVQPTTGLVRVKGRVGALLEVGTGFHPELTGRENIVLNGVVLGMSRREISRRFDDIVQFAGVERFLDTPLKRYSSGMYLRLAFAVAAHIDPDVVIVDEVLAVGDAEFQRRCLNRMSEFGSEGRTVLFVSHDPGLVGQLCRRALWLEEGRLRQDGSAQDVLAAYLANTLSPSERAFASLRPGGPLGEISMALVDESGEPRDAVRRDETLRLNLRLSTVRQTLGLDAALFVLDQRGTRVFMENASEAGLRLSSAPTDYDITVSIPPLLAEGEYRAGLWIGTEYETFLLADFLPLSVLPLPIDRQGNVRGVVRPSIEWDVNGRASHPPAR